MDLNLRGKSVVVTGGTRGIGYACCKRFMSEGAKVSLVGRKEESVEKALHCLRQETGGDAVGLCADLSKALAPSIIDAIAKSDIVVNNAGAIPGGDLDNVDDATWRAAWDLKVYGYINVVRAALPAMVARRSGVVVNIIGMAGAAPRYDYICGSMANASLIAFTKATGGYSSQHGVRVLGINPGPTQTERLISVYKGRANASLGNADQWEDLLKDLPFGRATAPEEIADLAVFLASPCASYVSGTVVDADGGAMFV